MEDNREKLLRFLNEIGIYERFIHNFYESNKRKNPMSQFNSYKRVLDLFKEPPEMYRNVSFIDKAFDWSRSKEGYCFWEDLYYKHT